MVIRTTRRIRKSVRLFGYTHLLNDIRRLRVPSLEAALQDAQDERENIKITIERVK